MTESLFGEQRAGGGDSNPVEQIPPLKESRDKIDAFMNRLLEALKKNGRKGSMFSVDIFRQAADGSTDSAKVAITFMNERFESFKKKEMVSPEQNIWSVQLTKMTDAGLSEEEWELMADDVLHHYHREATVSRPPLPPSGYRDSFQMEEDERKKREDNLNLLDHPEDLAARIHKISAEFKKHREGKKAARDLGVSVMNPTDASRLASILNLSEVQRHLLEVEARGTSHE